MAVLWEVSMKQSLIISQIALKTVKEAGILSLVRSFLFAFFPRTLHPRNSMYMVFPSAFIYTVLG